MNHAGTTGHQQQARADRPKIARIRAGNQLLRSEPDARKIILGPPNPLHHFTSRPTTTSTSKHYATIHEFRRAVVTLSDDDETTNRLAAPEQPVANAKNRAKTEDVSEQNLARNYHAGSRTDTIRTFLPPQPTIHMGRAPSGHRPNASYTCMAP